MTEKAIQEYLAIQRTRYGGATRRNRGVMIHEVVVVTGWHRKSAIRRLNAPPRSATARAGRPVEYGPHVADALLQLWHASGDLSSIVLHPIVPDLVARLTRHGDLVLDPAVEEQVLTASRSTVERLLASRRPRRRIHGQSMTRPATLLRHQIPVCTWSDRETRRPGHVGILIWSAMAETVRRASSSLLQHNRECGMITTVGNPLCELAAPRSVTLASESIRCRGLPT
jgi:hypothetical protein